jgi:hypothetical protein
MVIAEMSQARMPCLSKAGGIGSMGRAYLGQLNDRLNNRSPTINPWERGCNVMTGVRGRAASVSVFLRILPR